MATEYNKGRATELLARLNEGPRSHADWIILFANILGFLLNRYINED